MVSICDVLCLGLIRVDLFALVCVQARPGSTSGHESAGTGDHTGPTEPNRENMVTYNVRKAQRMATRDALREARAMRYRGIKVTDGQEQWAAAAGTHTYSACMNE